MRGSLQQRFINFLMKKLPYKENFYSGLSGIQLLIPRHQFPPPYENASRLTYYASFFNSIEINSSFYKLPMRSTVEKWYDSVTPDFRFTFKLSKDITHTKGLNFQVADVEKFMSVISVANQKKGCVLIQLPPSSGIENFSQLEKLLAALQKYNPENEWKFAVEFRNRSWYDYKSYELVESFKASIVIHDIPASSTPSLPLTSTFVYLRFHGPTGRYRDSYTGDFLAEYAVYINEWIEQRKTVYAYFNNTMGSAFLNCIDLTKNVVEF
jgi:uncharacterized protein YecE (DUF72 family)